MLYRVVRPVRRSGSRVPYFIQRIPADLKARVVGLKLAIPLAGTIVPLTITEKTPFIRLSLRTTNPSEAKVRQAEIAAYLEAIWRSLRENAPVSLTLKQATALSHDLYLSWAAGEDNERTVSGTIGFDGKWTLDTPPTLEETRAAWVAVVERWEALGASTEPADLEPHVGPLVSRRLLARGIPSVTPETRAILLRVFWEALRDGFASRKRNADGDYSPDPKAARYPKWEEPGRATASPAPKVSLKGLVESWWTEAKAAGRTISTYESYRNTVGRLADFLKHDDAAALTVHDIIAFKDHRLAQGVSPKTVGDSDIAGLRSIFKWAVANRKLTSDPTEGVKVTRAKATRTRSKGFTDAEAKAILKQAAEHVRGRESPKLFAAKRWVPWLCAYTGARVGELVQLRKEDVRQVGGNWVITITPEAGTVKDKEVRQVVLHPHLVDLGFPAFVGGSKPGYLFVAPKAEGDIRGVWQATKNRLAEFARQIVKDPEVAPNHGWRHLFKTVGREAGIEDSVLDGICGHAAGTVGGSYGEVSIAAQVRAFERFPRFNIDE
ncbi:DUF6538 domain-containing protein [Labrys monachus]|uniref:Integrase n=1 Tax=Labrys monachus TaxID=217067 RepID=A0ABU0FDK7_9HYPH|nr:phage integrase N-terminal SAM-like domain-containing protein [Labrys monachus]MDQ0392249.1 integrase [Labrys monachus]